MIDAIVLCGGSGTRIRHLLPRNHPKFLAPVWDGRPIGLHIIEWLRAQPEIGNVVLATSYGREKILSANLPVDGIDLWHQRKGVIPAARHALRSRYSKHGMLETETLLLVNGDTIMSFPLGPVPGRPTRVFAINEMTWAYQCTGLVVVTKEWLKDATSFDKLPWVHVTGGRFIDVGTPQGFERLRKKWP